MAHIRSPEADLDLDEIWDYAATNSGSASIADRLIDSITGRFFLLSGHPYLGRNRDEDLRVDLRSFPASNNVIIYRIEGEDVVILRVVRGSRNLETMFDR